MRASSLSWTSRESLQGALAGLRIRGVAPPSQAAPASPRSDGAGESAGSLTLPPFEVSSESGLHERLKAFLNWAIEAAVSEGAFIADDDGLPVLEHSVDAEMMAVSNSFIKLLDRLNASLLFPVGNHISISLKDRYQLQLLAVSTRHGTYTLGLIGDRPVPAALLTALEEKLRLSMERER